MSPVPVPMPMAMVPGSNGRGDGRGDGSRACADGWGSKVDFARDRGGRTTEGPVAVTGHLPAGFTERRASLAANVTDWPLNMSLVSPL